MILIHQITATRRSDVMGRIHIQTAISPNMGRWIRGIHIPDKWIANAGVSHRLCGALSQSSHQAKKQNNTLCLHGFEILRTTLYNDAVDAEIQVGRGLVRRPEKYFEIVHSRKIGTAVTCHAAICKI